MKLKAQAVDGFVARPDPRVATVLLYGPDAGLVAERGRGLAARIVDATAMTRAGLAAARAQLETERGRA